MKTAQQIEEKIEELNQKLGELDTELEELMELEEVDEFSERGEDLELEFENKKEVVEDQIKLLEWVLKG